MKLWILESGIGFKKPEACQSSILRFCCWNEDLDSWNFKYVCDPYEYLDCLFAKIGFDDEIAENEYLEVNLRTMTWTLYEWVPDLDCL